VGNGFGAAFFDIVDFAPNRFPSRVPLGALTEKGWLWTGADFWFWARRCWMQSSRFAPCARPKTGRQKRQTAPSVGKGMAEKSGESRGEGYSSWATRCWL